MSSTIALIRDLMFSSKVSSEARATGVTVQMIRDPAKLVDAMGDRLIVDLNQDGALDAAIAWKAAAPSRQVVGFVSHVDSETIAKARSASIDRIMPRSQFVAFLATLLRE